MHSLILYLFYTLTEKFFYPHRLTSKKKTPRKDYIKEIKLDLTKL